MKQYIFLFLFLVMRASGFLATGLKSDYQDFLEGKTIFITGGTGTLGKSLVYEILNYNPKEIIVFSRDEAKQFYLAQELNYNPKVKMVLGDVQNYDSLFQATKNVDIVIHAAALKRVESIESNVEEAIKTNVIGSINLFKACVINKVDKAIYVSTDKSCCPINAYGASKFLAEKIFNNYDRNNISTIFSSVRFGNIIGSTGSIMSIFSDKLKKNENVPLTDPRMTRFIITKEEAVECIFKAIRYAVGGEIFIKKLLAIKIVDFIDILKEKLESKSNVIVIGMRPGENKSSLPFIFFQNPQA